MVARAKRRLGLWGSASALAAVAACLLLAQPALAEPAAADVLLYSGNTADSDGFSSFGRAHADYTLEVPASLRVGENASIAYAFSWDGTGAVAQGGKAGHLLLFVSEEISVLDERARPASVWSDAGAPHSATAYYLDVPYAEAGAAGSVGIRLERPLYHDRDVLRAGPHEFQLQRTDGGAALADAGSLGDGYDARQMEIIRHIRGEDEDPLGRYDVVREPGPAVVAHVPPAALRSSTEPAGRPNLTAADWYDLAAFLEAVHAGGGSAAEYASALPFSEASLRTFFDSDARMAEITGYDRGLVTFGGSGGGSGGGTPYGGGSTTVTSSASVEPIDPEPIHIEGSYFVRTPHVTVPLFAATACAYDRNSTDGSHTLMYHGRTEACSPVYKSGAFSIRASSWDPDGDGSGPDIVLGVGFNRDSRGLSTVDAAGRPYALMDGRVRHNVAAGDYQEAPITLSPRYERPYAAYRAAVDAHAYFHELGRAAGEAVVQVPSGIDTPLLYEPAGPGGAPAAIKVRGPNAAEVMRGYGHHMMHSLHPDTPTCVSDMAAASGVSCSWAEGWAWFVAAAVGGDSYVSSSDFQIDLESGEYGVFWPDTGFPYAEGVSHSEGWAAAALWDVLDDAAEGGDGIDGTASGGGMASILDAIGDKRSGDPRPRNVLHWAHLWAPEGSAAMDGVLDLNNIEPDETAPELEAPPGKAFSAEGPATPLDEGDFGTASAVDYKNGTSREIIDPDPQVWNNAPDAFPVGDTVITWHASDFSGNVRNDTQTVSVVDYEPPKIFLNATEVFDGTVPVTPEVLLTRVFAADAVDPDPALVADFEGELPAGNHTVTWTATDDAGNSASDSQEVTVRLAADPAPPEPIIVVIPPANVTEEAAGEYTAVDIGAPKVIAPEGVTYNATSDAPEKFRLGTTPVIWTVTTGSGAGSAVMQTVIVVRQTVTVVDTTPPEIALDDLMLEASALLTPLNASRYAWALNVTEADPDPRITADAPELFPLGPTNVTWTATDWAGNSASATHAFVLEDTTPPSITAPSNITRYADGPVPVTDLGDPLVSDAVDGDPDVRNNAPDSFPLGTTVVTWTATDKKGNSNTTKQWVTVSGPVTIFSDGFEGTLDKWVEGGDGHWTISTPERHLVPYVPGSSAGNNVLHADWCVNECTIRLRDTIDLTGYSNATLTLWRFVDSNMIRGEYLQLQMHNGTGWRIESYWTAGWHGADRTWRSESYDLEQYLGSAEFNLQFNTSQALPFVDVQLDDIVITGIPRT